MTDQQWYRRTAWMRSGHGPAFFLWSSAVEGRCSPDVAYGYFRDVR
ncbi:hypothetical protein ABZ446_18020 [Streptomyces sp. NPDC005813]